MTTMVTGGTGFVGAYVVRRLVERGERVVCYDLAPVRAYLEDLFAGAVPEEVVLVRGDVTDAHDLTGTMKEHGVDRVVHLAAMIGPAAERRLPASLAVNVGGTVNVFEAAHVLDVRKVVWASSIGVYGPGSLNGEGRLDHRSLPDPRSAYGAAKALCERLAPLYARMHGLEITGLRFSSVYGYGKEYSADRRTWLDDLIARPARGERGVRVPGGTGSFDFQHVEDAARSVLCALDAAGTQGRTYLTHGDQRPVAEAVEHVRRLLPGSGPELEDRTTFMVFGGDGEGTRFLFGRRRTATDRLLDGSTTEAEIGYAPAYSMERGITETVQIYRAKAGLPPVPVPTPPAQV